MRVLNGTHTAMALISYLCGVDIVADAMADVIGRYPTQWYNYFEFVRDRK